MASAPLFLIPARGGSKGIPRKNLQHVDGVSLVGHAAACARAFIRDQRMTDARVVVDTDDAEIAEEGRRWGAEVPFLRPASLAADATTTLDSTLHLLDRLAADGWAADVIVLLQPTSPLRRVADLARCWARHRDGAASVVSVVAAHKPPQLAMAADASGILHWLGAPPPPNVRRQELTPAVTPSGAVYVVTVDALRARRAFVTPGLTVGVLCDPISSADVDAPSDLVEVRRAALLGAPSTTTQVVAACGAFAPDTGGRCTVGDSTLVAWPAAALDEAIGGPGRPAGEGVVLLLAPGEPGPASWRAYVGGPVGVWCEDEEAVVQHAVVLGGADFVIVPAGADGLGQLAQRLVDALHPLRVTAADATP